MNVDPGRVLQVVGAAYRLDGGEAEWLRTVAESAVPLLDGGIGVHAVTLRVVASMLVPIEVQVVGCPKPAVARFEREHRAHIAVSAYRGAAATLSETFGREMTTELLERSGLSREFGVRDAVRAGVLDPGGIAVMLIAPQPAPCILTRPAARRLRQLGAHLHTALRARRRRGDPDEAVLAPDGRVMHALADARAVDARERLRAAARAIDRARSRRAEADADDALGAWRAMVAGRWTLVDRFESDGRRFLVARPNAPRPAVRDGLTSAETTCALYASMGHSGKLIAYELGISESTVSTHLRSAMRKLGLRSRAQLAGALGPPTPSA